MTVTGERDAAIAGIGQSAVGRRLGRPALALTRDACLQAIEDAGLDRQDIDGLATWPGAVSGMAALAGPSTVEVKDMLGLELDWYCAGPEGPAQLNAVVNAALAISAGLANNVLVYRTVTESSAQGEGGRQGLGSFGANGVSGPFQWSLPFWAVSAANWAALYAQRHIHEYGTTREQLGAVALTARHHARMNPAAVYRDPLSMDDYLSARIISTPFGLYDCDVPVDGSVALVVTRADRAADTRKPVRIHALGTALRGRPYWDQFEDLTTMACDGASKHLWTRTDLTARDVDVAEIYDGFSFLTLAWLEALGFCQKGEGGPFVEGGDRIRLGGELPLNTHGGQLSAGRLHGYGFIHEAVTQLRREAGERQVAGAEVAVVANGGGPIAGCMLLTTDR